MCTIGFRIALISLALISCVIANVRAAPVLARLTTKSFNSTFAGLVFPYEPFDPSAGQLTQVSVQGVTLFTATGTAYPVGSGAYYPIKMQFDLSVPLPTGDGVSFNGPWQYFFNDAVGLNSPTLGGSMTVRYQYIPSDLGDNQIDNGNFDDGLNSWQADDPGEADLVTDNAEPGNTTGRPITLSQLVDTPNTPNVPFRLQSDYAFLTQNVSLDVSLDSKPLTTLISDLLADLAMGQQPDFEHLSIMIDDAALLGLADVPLALTWDGPTDSQILQDNIVLAPLTIPGARR